jgi:PAS domain S-box-containing protein
MSKVIGKQRRFAKSTLRKRAEEKLKGLTIGPQQLSAKDITSAIHELEVHQIELEMQNEELRRASVELVESQRRYLDIYEFAPIGYFVFDINGFIIEVNLTGASLLGVVRSSFINQPFSRYVERHDSDRFYLHFRKVLETQCSDSCEIKLNKNDGTVIVAQLKSRVGKDSKGNICQLLTAITDITERTLAEKRTKVSEERYRGLFEASREAILIIDASTGQIVEANPSIENILGYSRTEFIGKEFWEIALFKEIATSREQFLRLERQKYVHCEDLQIEKKSGEKTHVQLISNMYNVEHAKVIQFNITDVNDRKLARDRQKFIVQILECVNKEIAGESSFIRQALELLKEFTGVAAVGIRLQKDHDYPYLEANGFSDHFVETENHLCDRSKTGEVIYDSQGHPVLVCMCGCVLSGRTDPNLRYFTKNGSFWTNSTSKLQLDFPQNQHCKYLRNQCNKEGYESVALVPLRSNSKIIGLLQINDYKAGYFTYEMIHFFEGIGASLGIALARMKTEQDIQRINQELEQRVTNRTADLESSNKELRRQIKERERLETEILGISEREQKLLGQQLHDDVGQQYAGTALMLRALEEKLATVLPEDAQFVAKIAKQIDVTMDHIRRITRGLSPVDLGKDNLLGALTELSASTRDLGIHCTCRYSKNISLHSDAIAINMYRITQEAITNAIKHGKANNIQIKVTCNRDKIKLTVQNDGLDFQDVLPESKGMGLKIMDYRAGLVKGSLNVCRDANGGTIVTLCIPKPKR